MMRLRILRIQPEPSRQGVHWPQTLVGVEADAVAQGGDHVRVLVHHDHAGGAEAQASAAEADVVEVELDVELIGPEHAHRDSAADRALVLAALHAAGRVSLMANSSVMPSSCS